MHFIEWKFGILIQISMKIVANSPIDNMSALVKVMAWYLFGSMPLPEPMLTEIPNTIWHHWTPVSKHKMSQDS